MGTPFGVTIDGQTIEDDTVTLRERDSLTQERVPADELPALLAGRLAEPWVSPKLDS
ncbi:MAG: His/Gly/Thr/Pro-type tRNA ligase C-terminal domain-containing protein [Solirubrobacterales bacterium]